MPLSMFLPVKWTVVTKMLCLVHFFIVQSVEESSMGNGRAKTSIEEEHRQVVRVEERYLPMRTTFGEGDPLEAPQWGASTTAPPHWAIHSPPPLQESTPSSHDAFHHHSSSVSSAHASLSLCVSETPSVPFQLESRLLTPSRDAIKESVAMSGHLEIASKTSSAEDEIKNVASRPPAALEGTTPLHTHATIADL